MTVPPTFERPSLWHGGFDRRPYRVAWIADALREAIGTGELEPCQRLVETSIAERFGTSRATVREAIRELAHEGLIQLVPYRSAVVIGVSEDEIHEVLIPIRLVLERYGFRSALPHITSVELAGLEKTIVAMTRAATQGDLMGVVDADIRFHEAVLEASGSVHTLQVWRSISPRIRAYFLRYDRDRDLSAVVAEHRQLHAALEAGDAGTLLDILEPHIAVARLDRAPIPVMATAQPR